MSKKLRLDCSVYLKRWIVILTVLTVFFTWNGYGGTTETGYKFFKNYSFFDYDNHPQNWDFAQDQRGLLYVANQSGLLVFDGTDWQVVQIPNYRVRSLAIAADGTLYVGGQNQLGYLIENSTGHLEYQSLVDHLDNRYKQFSKVWRTHATEQGIYFRTTQYLFRWDGEKFKVWEIEGIRSSFVCSGTFFVQQQNVGLMQIKDNTFEPVPGGRSFADEKIWMMVPYNDAKPSPTLLVGTRQGFFLYDGKEAIPFVTELDDFVSQQELYHGIRLSNGNFALATLQGGMAVMDKTGRLEYTFDNTVGLQDRSVKKVFQDNWGNLWLALDKGISKIEYRSPFYIYDQRCGLPGNANALLRHRGRLYVGTSEGLYVLGKDGKKFRIAANISEGCWGLYSDGESLLAACTTGVFQLEAPTQKAKKILQEKAYALLPSRQFPGKVWCANGAGLTVLVKNGKDWRKERRVSSIEEPIRFIEEDAKGTLWLATDNTKTLVKVTFPQTLQGAQVTHYTQSSDLHNGEIYPALVAGRVIFATDQGLFRYDEKSDTFEPETAFGPDYAGGNPDPKPVFRLVEGDDKTVWLHSSSRNYKVAPRGDGTYGSDTKSNPFLRLPLAQVNHIYPDPDGRNTWFCGADGLIRYDNRAISNANLALPIFIEKILFDKTSPLQEETGITIEPDNTSPPPILSYKHRNLQVKCMAPFFENESKTRYRYFLEGHNDDWSAWTPDSQKDYTNLGSGWYNFRVQAKNVYGTLSREEAFKFKISPPWYLTWWAILLYAGSLIFSIFTFVKWRSLKLVREKQNLERVVAERTREIKNKSRQLEKQTQQLMEQSEKLKELDHIKSRFFANISHEFRTPLTLIMSPLEQMLTGSSDKKQKEKIKGIMRSSRHLLTLINQLLDLSRFDSGKMTLNPARHDLVRLLGSTVEAFDNLAQKNGQTLSFHSSREALEFSFDPHRMQEVFNNLLSNAFKFTPKGGQIEVDLATAGEPTNITRDNSPGESSRPGIAQISVRDSGKGIPEKQLSHIFDRFYQVESSNREIIKGTGIGLALSKEIVQLHGGTIDVHSREGRGTEFVVRLPLADLPPGADSKVEAQTPPSPGEYPALPFYAGTAGEYDDLEDDNIESGDEITPTTGNKDPKDGESQDKNVILVVEDHRGVRKHIRQCLEPLYKVEEAADGKEGIAKAKELIPDLIVSDIMMPGIEGTQLCRELKKDVATSHIPIVLLTAKASEESIIEGLETGADDYVTKPFNGKILLTRIKNLIELRRQLQLKIQRQRTLLPTDIQVSSTDEKFLKEFHQVIEDNISNPDFNVDHLCKTMVMGRSTLFRKVQALTGETPNQYIMSCRLERAAQLLKKKFGNVTEVAFEVGFSSSPYFAKCFKARFHQAPSEYQATHGTTTTPSTPGPTNPKGAPPPDKQAN